MHLDSKSLRNDMASIYTCSFCFSLAHTAPHTYTHMRSGNKHTGQTLLLRLLVWHHGVREMSICQMASLKVPQRLTILYNQGRNTLSSPPTHTHSQIHKHESWVEEKLQQVRLNWISWHLLGSRFLRDLFEGFCGSQRMEQVLQPPGTLNFTWL